MRRVTCLEEASGAMGRAAEETMPVAASKRAREKRKRMVIRKKKIKVKKEGKKEKMRGENRSEETNPDRPLSFYVDRDSVSRVTKVAPAMHTDIREHSRYEPPAFEKTGAIAIHRVACRSARLVLSGHKPRPMNRILALF